MKRKHILISISLGLVATAIGISLSVSAPKAAPPAVQTQAQNITPPAPVV